MRYTYRYASQTYRHFSERGVLALDAPGMILHLAPVTDAAYHEVTGIVVTKENSVAASMEIIEIVRLSDDGTWPVVFGIASYDNSEDDDRGFRAYTTEPTVDSVLYRASWYTDRPWVWRPTDGEGITMVVGGTNPRIGIRLSSTPPESLDIQGYLSFRSLWAQ